MVSRLNHSPRRSSLFVHCNTEAPRTPGLCATPVFFLSMTQCPSPTVSTHTIAVVAPPISDSTTPLPLATASTAIADTDAVIAAAAAEAAEIVEGFDGGVPRPE